jgi:hypothetical protein
MHTICSQCSASLTLSNAAFPHFDEVFATNGLVPHRALPSFARCASHGPGITYAQFETERLSFKRIKEVAPILTGEARRQKIRQTEDLAFAMNVRFGLAAYIVKNLARRAVDNGTKLEDEFATETSPLARLEALAYTLMSKYPVTPKCRENAVKRAFERGTSLEDELDKALRGMHRRWERAKAA